MLQVVFSGNSEFKISTSLFKSQLVNLIESLEMVTEETLLFDLLIKFEYFKLSLIVILND